MRRLISLICPTAARVLAANALLTAGGASSCGERNASRTAAARRSMLRWRPPRLSAERIWEMLSRAASRGPGAVDSTPTASPWASSGKASSAPGKYSLSALRSRLADAVPDELLVGAGEDAHGAGLVAVAGDLAVVVAVGAYEVGEQPGVAGVGLRASDMVALTVARRRARVDGVDVVAGRDQCRDPGAAVGLDADHDLAGPGGVLCDQFVQCGDPRDALGQPPGGEALAGFVHELDVMVVLGPVVAHIQDHLPVLLCFEPLDADPVGESQRRPNGTVLAGTTPHECCGTTQIYQPALGLPVAVQKPREP